MLLNMSLFKVFPYMNVNLSWLFWATKLNLSKRLAKLYSPNQVLNFQNNRKKAQAMQLFFGLYSAANKFYFSASHHEQKNQKPLVKLNIWWSQ